MENLNFIGIGLGIVVFLIIGAFHPIVIKAEYYFGTKSWGAFLIVGIITATISLFFENAFSSTSLGVFAFFCFWSIIEVFEQKERVRKGLFPKNPKRKE